MNAPSPLTDIRVGDLVKARLKDRPETAIEGRVVAAEGSRHVSTHHHYLLWNEWDFEVLDRPIPPIDEDLRNEVTAIWRNPRHTTVAEALTAIIHHVTEHNNKESK